MTHSKDLYFQAAVQQAKEQILELSVSLTLPLLRETSRNRYETVENLHVVVAAKELYSTGEAKYEMTGAYVITKSKGIMFYNVDLECIDNPTPATAKPQPAPSDDVVVEIPQSAKDLVEEAEMEAMEDKPRAKAEPQPKPAPSDDEQKQMVAEVVEKATAAPKQAKPTTAKAGGIKSKEKRIVDMSAADLKSLAKKHSIDYSTVNFRKADEKDAFRSKLAKALGRSSELNYSVK